MNKIKEKIISDYRFLFAIESIIFGACFLLRGNFGDDFSHNVINQSTLLDFIKYLVYCYKNSSARVILGIIVLPVNTYSEYLFIPCMVISMYVLLYSINTLFNRNNNILVSVIILFLVSLYPFEDFCSAGWVTTTTCYFVPIALMFYSLIPIVKIYDNEIIKRHEKILFVIALIFAANNEQVMVVLLGCYVVFNLHLLVNHRVNYYSLLMLVLTILSAMFILLCPGNSSRAINEMIVSYPTYGMLNIIDKLDIGIYSTIIWMFFDGIKFVYIILAFMTIFTFIKSKNPIVRIISLIPELLIFTMKNRIPQSFDPLFHVYADSKDILSSISYGLFDIDSIFNFETYIIAFLLLMILFSIVIELFVILDKEEEFILSLTLVVFGFGSRVAMALSPTVFSSQLRTFSILGFCIIGVGVYLFSKIINIKNKKIELACCFVMISYSIVSYAKFFGYVMNYLK